MAKLTMNEVNGLLRDKMVNDLKGLIDEKEMLQIDTSAFVAPTIDELGNERYVEIRVIVKGKAYTPDDDIADLKARLAKQEERKAERQAKERIKASIKENEKIVAQQSANLTEQANLVTKGILPADAIDANRPVAEILAELGIELETEQADETNEITE